MAFAALPWVLLLHAVVFGSAQSGAASENPSDVNVTAGLLADLSFGDIGLHL